MSDAALRARMESVPSGAECAFPQAEFDARLARLRPCMAAKGIDLLLIPGAENIFYLCGQQTPGYYMFQCLAVPLEGEPFLVVRGLELLNARLKTRLADIEGYEDGADPAAALAAALTARGWRGKRVAIDRNAWFLTVNLHDRLVAAFGALLDGSFLVEPLRRVKSPLEIQCLEHASVSNDAGMLAGLARVRAGAMDNAVAAAILAASVEAGSEYVGMEPFVTAGWRAGVPHTTWCRKRIEPGDVVIVETSGCYNRYHVGLYRTVMVGKVPDHAYSMYAVCEEALAAATEAMRPGTRCSDVHAAVQAVIDRHGYTDGFRKRSGYSLGISFAPDWGEGDILSLNRGVEVLLEPGMAFHVPITLRDYGRFTVAVSDSLLVTESGCRRLSRLDHGLVRA